MAEIKKTLRSTETNSSLTRLSGVVTVTLAATHSNSNLKVGQTIVIKDSTATTDDFNGSFTITTVASQTQFTYAQTGEDESDLTPGTSGGDYSTMTLWEAGEQQDLPGEGATAVLECYNDWGGGLSDSGTIVDWTTDATHFITVKAAEGEGHDGVIGGGFWMRWASNGNDTLKIQQSYVTLEGLELTHSAAGTALVIAGNYVITVDGIILSSTAAGRDGLVDGNGGTKIIRNTLAHSCSGMGFSMGNAADTEFYNCSSIANGEQGFHAWGSSPDITAKNCVSYGNTGDDFGTGLVTVSNNASGDSTATGTGSITGITSADFYDYDNDDFRIDQDSALYNAGVDPTTFTDDITGTTRSQWSIGMFDPMVRTLKSTGGDYATFTAWQAGEQANLVALNQLAYAELDGSTPFNPGTLTLSGWTTDADHFITIKTTETSHHRGVLGGSGAACTTLPASDYLSCYHIAQAYTVLQGLEADLSAETTDWRGGFGIWASNVVVDSCIMLAADAANCWAFAVYRGLNDQPIFRNCLAYGHVNSKGVGFVTPSSGSEFIAENCTALNCQIGFYSKTATATPHTKLINCIAAECGAIDMYSDTADGASGEWHAETKNNATSDTTAPGVDFIKNLTTSNFYDYAGKDFRIDLDSILYDAGASLTTFTKDVTNTTRSQWSIGFFDPIVRTLKTSGGDYNLCSSWEAAEQEDLVALNQLSYLECYAGTYLHTSTPDIAGWTTGPDHFITIEAAAGEEHWGVYGDGVIFRNNNSYRWMLQIQQSYTAVRQIEMSTAAAPAYTGGVHIMYAQEVSLRDIIVDLGSIYTGVGFRCDGDFLTLINCVAKNCSATAFVIAQDTTLYNCTAIDSYGGFLADAGSVMVIKNCVGFGNAPADFKNNGASISGSNNASGDTSASTLLIGTVTGIDAADFTSYSGGNFLPSANSALQEAGLGVSTVFDTDITGTLRTGTWDIGAFESTPPVGASVSPLGFQNLNNQFMPIAALRINGVIQ